jgi:hypothetical protein
MRQLSGLRALGLSRISPSSSSFQTSTIFDPYFSPSLSTTRSFSQLVKSNGKHLFLVDTLALVIPLFPFILPFLVFVLLVSIPDEFD